MTLKDKLIKLNDHMKGFAFYICKRNREEAEDCVEYAIIATIKNRAKYESLPLAAFKKVVNAIIYNRFLDLKRLKYKRQDAQRNCRVEDYTWATYIRGEGSADSRIQVKEIEAAIESLSPKYKQVIKMMVTGYKQEEIAKEMGVARSSVAVNIIRARDILQKKLQV